MELKPCVQKYEWGKPAEDSVVAKLYSLHDHQATTVNSPFAELWMGTHPNGPATLVSTGAALKDVIETLTRYLGAKSIEKFGHDLPFLLKVLSVDKALSIQAHPSKSHAEILHQQKPDLYKDPNHKPELAIALTEFRAMCGFRPVEEIHEFLREVPQLKIVIGEQLVDRFLKADPLNANECLKECFRGLMTCSPEVIAEQLGDLLEQSHSKDTIADLLCLVRSLNYQFPRDVGCFGPFFMNVVTLQPGEAIYLGPNEPHAYLEGDCVECMACSDNVVRAGLTPKFKDVDTLIEMLIYTGSPPETKLFKPQQENQHSVIYRPPVPDFAVAKIELPKQSGSHSLIVRETASILLCVSGKGRIGDVALRAGSVIFVPANEGISVELIEEDLLMFQAMANL